MKGSDNRFEALKRTIEIRQRGNLIFATSEEEPTLFVSAYNEDELAVALRYQLAQIFNEIHNLPVEQVVIERECSAPHKFLQAWMIRSLSSHTPQTAA